MSTQVSEASKSLEVVHDLNHLLKYQSDDGTRRALQGYRGTLLSVMKKEIGNTFGMHHKSSAQLWYATWGRVWLSFETEHL